MDLFHTITQEIENVLSCHWLSEFRESQRNSGSSSSNNSSNNSRSNSNSPSPSVSRSVSRSASVAASPLRHSASSASVSGASDKNLGLSVSEPRSPVLSAVSTQLETKKSNMSDKLMDTERGGEQTQYESIQTVTNPPTKEEGQLGDSSTTTDSTSQDSTTVDAARGEQTAENIRYGQNISESGVGGFTNTVEGTANQEGGYGGTKSQDELEGNVSGNAGGRTEQGYTAKDGVHDYKVGG